MRRNAQINMFRMALQYAKSKKVIVIQLKGYQSQDWPTCYNLNVAKFLKQLHGKSILFICKIESLCFYIEILLHFLLLLIIFLVLDFKTSCSLFFSLFLADPPMDPNICRTNHFQIFRCIEYTESFSVAKVKRYGQGIESFLVRNFSDLGLAFLVRNLENCLRTELSRI